MNAQEINDGKISFSKYIKKRCIRILPQYYIYIFVTLCLMDGAYYISKGEHALDIMSHILLIHNLIPSYHGTINGVLWTMGVIFQFYIVAIPLYRLVKKRGTIALGIGILSTIVMKSIVYKMLVDRKVIAYTNYQV